MCLEMAGLVLVCVQQYCRTADLVLACVQQYYRMAWLVFSNIDGWLV